MTCEHSNPGGPARQVPATRRPCAGVCGRPAGPQWWNALRRWAVVWLSVLTGLACAGFGPPVIRDGNYPPRRLYPEQIDAMRRLVSAPGISAGAGLILDVDAGQTLYALHEHQALPPASAAKLMTALLVLSRVPLTDTVQVSARAASTGGSTMGLQAGEKLSVHDLLYGLLLPSGNDAAVALAEHVSGSEEAFVAQMNQQAAQMGLGESHFGNADGEDLPQQVTSAADLLTIARADLSYPEFVRVVATRETDVAGRHLVNTNQLLGTYPGADGIKTGTTDAAGECLVASVTRNGHRLLLVLLHSADRYADARALLDYVAAGWSWRPVTLPDDALASEFGPDGQLYRLRAASAPDVFLPNWQWALVRPVRVLDLKTLFTGNQPVGSLLLTLDGNTLARVPLTAWPGP